MTRKECLEQAMECVLQDRARQYGTPEDNFGRIARLWTDYTGCALDGIDVAMMMALLKVARIRSNKDYSDGYIDLAGYAACGAELAGAQKAREDATRRWSAEYKKLRAEAEGDAKAEDCEEPEFKQGDAVELRDKARNKWMPCVYLRKAVDPGYSIVQSSDCGELLVSSFYLRKAEANHPENPDSSTEVKPRFKHGDKVQCRVTLPSVSDRIWVDGDYVRYEKGRSRPHVVFTRAALELVSDEDIRPALKAEGCEELVQHDAPQTPQELYQHIVDCNPATFGRPRTPTGEELAEMAEEDAHE